MFSNYSSINTTWDLKWEVGLPFSHISESNPALSCSYLGGKHGSYLLLGHQLKITDFKTKPRHDFHHCFSKWTAASRSVKALLFLYPNYLFPRFLPNFFSPHMQELQEWFLFRWQIQQTSPGDLGSPCSYKHWHMGFHAPVLPETLQTMSREDETHAAKEQLSCWKCSVSKKRMFCSPPPLKPKLILSSPCLFCYVWYF